MKTNIKGVGVALITPFNDNGDVDFEALERFRQRDPGQLHLESETEWKPLVTP